VSWIIKHVELLKPIPLLFNISKKILEFYKRQKENADLAVLRSLRFKIHLDLSLYIDEGESSNDLIPYLQQLASTSLDLKALLDHDVRYAEYYINFNVYDTNSDRKATADLANLYDRSVLLRVIKKLSKVDASKEFVNVQVIKSKLGLYRILSK
jgi:hypothetical protein